MKTYQQVKEYFDAGGEMLSRNEIKILLDEIANEVKTLSSSISELEQIKRDNESEIISKTVELEEARERIAEWEEANKKVLQDQCPTDEKHCGCVVFLRKRIEELQFEKNLIWEALREREEELADLKESLEE